MLDQLKIGNVYSYDSYFASVRERSIGTPKRKTIKETVPFSNVTYDFSAINGEVYYEERSLQYIFEITADSPAELEELKSAFASWVMGVMQEKLYDPFIKDYHFLATYDELSFADEEDVEKTTATVKFTAYPYKIANDTKEIVIPLYAYEEADAEILNNSSHRVTPTLNASVPVTVKVGENSYSIPSGEVRSEIVKFPQGKTNVVIQNKEKVYSAFSGEEIVVPNSSEAAFRNLNAYGKSWQNGTPTSSAPIDVESAKEVKVLGKNLLPPENVTYAPQHTQMYYPVVLLTYKFEKGKTYTVSFDTPNSGVFFYINNVTGFDYYSFYGNGQRESVTKTFTEDVEVTNKDFISIQEDIGVEGGLFSNIQIELNDYATEYKPYTEQTLTLPYELNGADGVYDEIDFERKKFIQRWLRFRPNKTLVFEGAHADVTDRYALYLPPVMDNYVPFAETKAYCNRLLWSAWGLESGTFFIAKDGIWYRDSSRTLEEVNEVFAEFGTDIEFVAQLETPIETDLTDEEVAAYQTLRSNEPSTTILADANIEVEVAVVPDEPVQVGTIKISFAEEVL